MKKKLLIVVDMQNDFIDGALGSNEAVAILPAVKAKIDEYLAAGAEVVYTRDTHYSDSYLNSQEGRNLPVPHCIEHTNGWEIHKDIWVPGNVVIDKVTFGFKGWASYLGDGCTYESVELIGLCTDICVISNAMLIKAFCPELPVIVDASCCAGVTPASHENALAAMEMCQIKVINK